MADSCSVADTINGSVWQWHDEWYDKYPMLKNVKVLTIKSGEKDTIVWMTNEGKKVKFSISNVRKDVFKWTESWLEDISMVPTMYSKALFCIVDGCPRKASYTR